MANSSLTPDMITKESQTILHNNLVFCRNINRQYDDSNQLSGQKNGGAIRIRLPNKYTTVTGAALSAEDTIEQSVTLPRGTQRHVDTNFTSIELTLDIDTFSQRILEPGISTLASTVDWDAYSMYQNVGQSVGTPGTTPATAEVLLNSHVPMDNQAVSRSGRYATLNPNANAAMVDGLKGLFHAGSNLENQYKAGLMSENTLGYREVSMTQSVRTHTTGAFAGTVLIDDAAIAEGDSTIGMDAFTDAAPTVKKGDVFTIAGVNSVNPETKQDTGSLQQFVVTADATGATNEITSVAFSPPLYTATSKGLQNITALPVNNAAVTFVGTASTTYPQNMGFHRDAFILATTDLEMPEGVHFSSRQVMDGISMRLLRQYRIGTDDIPCRIDVLYAYVTTRGEMATRIWG